MSAAGGKRGAARVAVLGASGYTGRELLRLLAAHPGLELEGAFSARADATPEPPELPVDAPVEALDWARVGRCAGVFLCTPHGASAVLARECLARGAKVVDLSADFRLGDAARHEQVYQHPHGAPELLGEAVYGLSEHARERIAAARLVANPGCYPTAALLALVPLIEAGLVDAAQPLVIDAKSGVSGAGKTPSARTHFCSTHENFLAYGLGTHRHAPEIALHAGLARLTFVPHLLPVLRGILETIYLAPVSGARAADLRACLAERYAHERFVRVFERGLPELRAVQATNECHLAAADCGAHVVVVAAIDNLLKGAAGQALQNMNLMLGQPEQAGL